MPPGKSSVRDCDEKELVVPRLSASHLRISSANFFQQTGELLPWYGIGYQGGRIRGQPGLRLRRFAADAPCLTDDEGGKMQRGRDSFQRCMVACDAEQLLSGRHSCFGGRQASRREVRLRLCSKGGVSGVQQRVQTAPPL